MVPLKSSVWSVKVMSTSDRRQNNNVSLARIFPGSQMLLQNLGANNLPVAV